MFPSPIGPLRVVFGTPLRRKTRGMRRRMLADAADCRTVQRRTLARILAANADSDWMRDRELTAAIGPHQLSGAAAITTYDDYAGVVEQMLTGRPQALLGSGQRPVMFALSSGTTGRSKHIPVTPAFLADYRRGWQAWGIGTFDAHRRLHTHNIFQIASSHRRGVSGDGVPCGNISGLVQTMQSPVVRQMYSVPQAALSVGDPIAKSYAALRAGVADGRVAMAMAANPSTLLQLAELAQTRTEDLIRDLYDGTLSVAAELPRELRRPLSRRNRRRARVLDALATRDGVLKPSGYWPHLSVLACWTGGSCAAYLPRLRELYRTPGGEPIPIRDHGLSASEGRMTIPIDDETPSGLLDIASHFYEFLPIEAEGDDPDQTLEERRPLLAHELTVGESYFILLTTASGLVRYDIHDVVRCTGFFGTTPLLEFLHKGAHIASLTGEKITESQVVAAVRTGCGAAVFTVAPEWCQSGDRADATAPDCRVPRYVLLIEAPAEAAVDRIDRALRASNEEYDDKRASGRLGELVVRELPHGTFAALARKRQSGFGASAEQYKHPFLMPALDAIATLEALPLEGELVAR